LLKLFCIFSQYIFLRAAFFKLHFHTPQPGIVCTSLHRPVGDSPGSRNFASRQVMRRVGTNELPGRQISRHSPERALQTGAIFLLRSHFESCLRAYARTQVDCKWEEVFSTIFILGMSISVTRKRWRCVAEIEAKGLGSMHGNIPVTWGYRSYSMPLKTLNTCTSRQHII
jgi:hypothetical protein